MKLMIRNLEVEKIFPIYYSYNSRFKYYVNFTYNDLNLLDGAQANTIAASKAVVYGSGGEVKANTITLGNWTITESGSELKFAYSGTNKYKITSGGATVAEGDVTAFGSA